TTPGAPRATGGRCRGTGRPGGSTTAPAGTPRAASSPTATGAWRTRSHPAPRRSRSTRRSGSRWSRVASGCPRAHAPASAGSTCPTSRSPSRRSSWCPPTAARRGSPGRSRGSPPRTAARVARGSSGTSRRPPEGRARWCRDRVRPSASADLLLAQAPAVDQLRLEVVAVHHRDEVDGDLLRAGLLALPVVRARTEELLHLLHHRLGRSEEHTSELQSRENL